MMRSAFLLVVVACVIAYWFRSAVQQQHQLETIHLQRGDAKASVSVYAAHVLSYTVNGKDVLFLSKRALFEPPKAIRGGIPLIFPQFSNRGSLPSHGFARNSFWKVVKHEGSHLVSLELEDNESTRKVFPPFRALYTVELAESGALNLTFNVEAKESDLSFTMALHSYFSADISQTKVFGLENVSFQNHLDGMKVGKEERKFISFDGEVDRTYLSVPRELSIGDGSRIIRLSTSSSLADAVVWNPWIEKSLKMSADFDPLEYKQMVCVEVGAVASPVVLKAGKSWKAVHTISVNEGAKL